MIGMNKYILSLIEKNASINEICEATKLSYKQLLIRINSLKSKGYNLEEKYYYDGEICYDLKKGINKKNVNDKTIITRHEDKTVRVLFLSDLHLGNINERIDLLYKVYEFCINNDIHIIVNAGDIIDGSLKCGRINEKYIYTFDDQVDYLVKNHPYDKNILNFICFGNHEYSWLKEYGYDISERISNSRTDLIPVGYGLGKINIKNDRFIVFHYIPEINYMHTDHDCRFKVYGHSHKFKFEYPQSSFIKLSLPSLSNLSVHVTDGFIDSLPSMAVCEFNMTNGMFNNGYIQQYVFVDNKFIRVNETNFNMSNGKNMGPKKILNEEERLTLIQTNLIDLFKYYKKELNLKESIIRKMIIRNNVIDKYDINQNLDEIRKLELKRQNNVFLNRDILKSVKK